MTNHVKQNVTIHRWEFFSILSEKIIDGELFWLDQYIVIFGLNNRLGVNQLRTCWSYGIEYVTQYPIQTRQSFEYYLMSHNTLLSSATASKTEAAFNIPSLRNKLLHLASTCVFLGYPTGYKGYKLPDLTNTSSLEMSYPTTSRILSMVWKILFHHKKF